MDKTRYTVPYAADETKEQVEWCNKYWIVHEYPLLWHWGILCKIQNQMQCYKSILCKCSIMLYYYDYYQARNAFTCRLRLLPPPRRLCFCQTLFVCLFVCVSAR